MPTPMFDYCVSNPPYQQSTGNTRHRAIYHAFMESSQNLCHSVSMIYPARWMIGGHGEGIGHFRDRELSSRHYESVEVISDSTPLFPGTSIAGGVNIVHWRTRQSDHLTYIYDGRTHSRSTLIGDLPVMCVDPDHARIAAMIPVSAPLSPQSTSYYGEAVKSDYKIEALAASLRDDDDSYRVFYSGRCRGVHTARVPTSATTKDAGGYKVFMSSCASGRDGSLRRPERLFLAGPHEICSVSYIQFGPYDTELQAQRCRDYLTCDIITFLVGVLTTTQHLKPEKFSLVPAADFDTGCIIGTDHTLDFDSTTSLDEQLSAIYHLTARDRQLITASIRHW